MAMHEVSPVVLLAAAILRASGFSVAQACREARHLERTLAVPQEAAGEEVDDARGF